VNVHRGSAAPTCGKPPAFRPIPLFSFCSAQAGRLSLPACVEQLLEEPRCSERPSLSASQAAKPQGIRKKIAIAAHINAFRLTVTSFDHSIQRREQEPLMRTLRERPYSLLKDSPILIFRVPSA